MSHRSHERSFRPAQIAVLSIVLWGLPMAGTGHALEPIKVWLYGDGESSRMFSELKYFPETQTSSPARIAVYPQYPMNSTGPDLPQGGFSDLYGRMKNDLDRSAAGTGYPWPDVVHIGYNASAHTYANCAWNNPNWQSTYVDIAFQEANAIKKAADHAKSRGVKVLLTLGPGSPDSAPIAPCMNAAFTAVSFILYFYYGVTYPYVDYSGYSESSRGSGGVVDPALVLDRNKTALWMPDNVHVSCDMWRFEPLTEYSMTYCIQVANQAEREAKVGAWRVARTVLKAYKSYQ